MDSSVMRNNYATSGAIQLGLQVVTLLSEKVTFDQNVGQFAFPFVTPNANMSEAYDRTMPKTGTGNIINRDNLGVTNITNSNYIELTVPKHLFYIMEIQTMIKPNATMDEGHYASCSPVATHKIIYNEFLKGQQFLITSLGGNINKPYIIGVI